MFIVITSYSQPPEKVKPHFADHCQWLHLHNKNGNFLGSGPKKSGLGGAILVRGDMTKAELRKILDEDSYAKADVVDYLIVDMDFKLIGPGLEKLLATASSASCAI
jgi:uncharacterized protein YciI